MRIGILGGSFNPVHQQHLRMGTAAMAAQRLDEIWFVPVFQPVHKPGASLLGYEQRLGLLQTAIAGYSGFRVCEIEKELGGPSYTVNTVDKLKQKFAGYHFFLLIGGDSLQDLPTWFEIDRLVTMCEFIVIDRPGYQKQSPVPAAVIGRAECEPSPISATRIRAQLGKGIVAGIGLDNRVVAEILRHNYYACLDLPTATVLQIITRRLITLPQGLVEHIEGVARLAVSYALDNAVDASLALLAALAHDLYRIAPAAEILQMAAHAKRQLSDIERQLPMLAHGAAAAGFLTQSGVGVPDSVLAAVCDHTFPHKDSPQLTKIIAVADTLEPSRNIVLRDQLRESGRPFAELFTEVLQIKADRLSHQ